MNEKKQLRILFVEDLLDDVIIAEEVLKRDGIVFEAKTVMSIDELKIQLDEFRPDIVISDYNLPGFNAIDVLNICKHFDPQMPFIVFTGSISEDAAVMCLKKGADDYVLKSHLQKLPHSVREAIEKKEILLEKEKIFKALQESEERYRYITHTISDYAYAFRVEEDGTMWGEWVSESFVNVFGLTIPEIDARGGWQTVVYPEDLPSAIEHAKKVISGKKDTAIFRFVTKDGAIRWLRDYAVPVFDERTGRVIKIYGASQDITGAKQLEEELQELANRFNHYLSSSPTITYALRITQDKASPLWVSENIKEITGYSVSEALMENWWRDNIHPEDKERALKESSQIFQKNAISHKYRFRKKDGSYMWVHDELKLIRNDKGDPVEAIGTWTDVTEKKLAEERLNEQMLLLSSIMETSPAGVVITDEKGTIIYANKTFCSLMGHEYKDVSGASCEELQCRFINLSGEPLPLDEIPVKKALKDRKTIEFVQFIVERPDGKKAIFSANAAPVIDNKGNLKGAVCIILDITEHKRLEEQYLQAQKLEAVGRLAGGVAHDFNNLLSAIIGFAEIALMQMKKDDPLRDYIKTIYEAGEKAKTLIQQLLIFSRRQIQRPEVLNLNDVITELQKMLTRIIGEDITLNILKDDNLDSIKADRAQIEQVIMNLVVNARDAMPEGGRLTIETRNIEVTDKYSERYIDLSPGRYVMLSVADTGTGMSEEVKARIFEPFFTTKGPVKGTGLGLATVYGIVKQHNGHIHFYSEVGKGTTFKIYLPSVEERAEKRIPVTEMEIKGGTETIVIVEDSEDVREFATLALREKGYNVKTFSSPLKTLEYIEKADEEIHLLLTDLVMPEMSGRELAERVKMSRKDIRIIFMSGYTDDSVIAQEISSGASNFLSKPFTYIELLKKVRETLS